MNGLPSDTTIARVRLAQGRPDEARELVARTRVVQEESGAVTELISIGVLEAACAEATGHRAEALRALGQAVELAAPGDYAGTLDARPPSEPPMHMWLHRPMRRRGQIVEVLGTAALVVFLSACVGAGVPGTSSAVPTGSTVPKPVSTPSAPIASDQMTATPAVIVVPPPVPIGVASAAPTVGHASDLRTITLADDRATVSVAVGEEVLVKLGTDLVWTVQVSDATVLVRVRGVALIVGAQGLYAAAKAGTTLVTAIGDAACRTAVPPCMVPSRLFSVTIVVH